MIEEIERLGTYGGLPPSILNSARKYVDGLWRDGEVCHALSVC
jgi:hypothetical protein